MHHQRQTAFDGLEEDGLSHAGKKAKIVNGDHAGVTLEDTTNVTTSTPFAGSNLAAPIEAEDNPIWNEHGRDGRTLFEAKLTETIYI